MRNTLARHLYNSGILHIGYDLNKLVTLTCSSRFDIGTNAYDRKWDLLVVLDACRPEAMREVANEYEFIQTVDSIWSVGSATPEWVANTFSTDHLDEVQNTTYVASHGGCQWIFEQDDVSVYEAAGSSVIPLSVLDYLTDWSTVTADDFAEFDLTWKYRRDNKHAGTTLPETVTDRAVALGRCSDSKKMVAHYKQPHAPYVANAITEGRDLQPHEADPWKYLRDGGSRDKVWAAYLDELRWGLDNVAVLLENIDADRVVITADHGEFFGEWGMYSHPLGVFHPSVRRVPWVETTAVDSGDYEPSVDPADYTDEELTDQLEHLGYL